MKQLNLYRCRQCDHIWMLVDDCSSSQECPCCPCKNNLPTSWVPVSDLIEDAE